MRNFLERVRQDEVRAAAVEYGLIAAALSVVIIAVVTNIARRMQNTFQTVSGAL